MVIPHRASWIRQVDISLAKTLHDVRQNIWNRMFQSIWKSIRTLIRYKSILLRCILGLVPRQPSQEDEESRSSCENLQLAFLYLHGDLFLRVDVNDAIIKIYFRCSFTRLNCLWIFVGSMVRVHLPFLIQGSFDKVFHLIEERRLV